jgi:hypothetical protein
MNERQLIVTSICFFLLSLTKVHGQKKEQPDSTGRIMMTSINDRNRPSLPPIRLLGSDTYVRQLGIICRQEWKLEKSTGIPFRFRLGSLEYVNRMEGKKN